MVQVPVNQQLRPVHIQPLQLLGQNLTLGGHEQRVQCAFELFKVSGSRMPRAQRRARVAQPFHRGVCRRGIGLGRMKYSHRGSPPGFVDLAVANYP